MTFAAAFLILSGSMLANAAGVGGGPLFIPIYIYFLHFSVKDAIALSPATIVWGIIIK